MYLANKNQSSVSFSTFRRAVASFADDYAIVGHAGEPTVSMFGKPKPAGKYSVAGINGLTENQVNTAIKQANVFATACMDKRGVHRTWELVQQLAPAKRYQ